MDKAEAIRRAESLVDLVDAHAAAGEADRRVADDVIAAVERESLFEVAVPSSIGGHGLGLDTLGEVTRILARACPATAWTVSFLMLHAWLLSRLPDEGREEVFAGSVAPRAPAPLAPTGVAKPVDGGFVVSGRWEWATACAHADWAIVNTVVEGPQFETRFVVLPMHEVTVDDVWFTSGMRATRSNTLVIQDRFVPIRRTAIGTEMFGPDAGIEGDGLAGIPVPPVLALVAAAPAVGGAEGAAELYRTRLQERVLAYTLGDKAVDQPAAQIRLAEVEDLARTAGARWRSAIQCLCSGREIGAAERVDARLAAASAVRTARRAVTTACEGAGASVFFESHPLQRVQRDLETLQGHVIFDWDRTAELAGRHHLGFELRPTDLV